MPGRRTPPIPARLGAAMREQRVDQGAVGVSRRRMDDEAGGLVDDDQMCILKADIERQRLRGGCWVLRLGEEYDEILARPDPQRRIARRRSVVGDPPLLDQPLEPGARQCRQMQRQHPVEAHPRLVRRGADRDRGAGEALGGFSRARHRRPRPAGRPTGRSTASGLGRCGGSRSLVVVMGVMIVIGTAALIAGIASKMSHNRPAAGAARPFAASAIDIPRGARIEAMTAAPDRLILGSGVARRRAPARRHRFGDGCPARHYRAAFGPVNRRGRAVLREPRHSFCGPRALVPARSRCEWKIHLESLAIYSELLADTVVGPSGNPMTSKRLSLVRAGCGGVASARGTAGMRAARVAGRLRSQFAAARAGAASRRFP